MKKLLLSFFMLLGMTTVANAAVEIWPGTKNYIDANYQQHSVSSISINNLNEGDWAAIMNGSYSGDINFGGTFMNAAQVKAKLESEEYGYVKFSQDITLNSNDLAAMNGFSTVVLDMKNATFAEGTSISRFASADPLEYAVFPIACEDLSGLASARLNLSFKSAAAYSKDDKRVVGYVKKEGTFNAALLVAAGQYGNDVGYPVESYGGYWHNVTPETMTLAGNLNALDLAGVWPNGNDNFKLDTYGHLYYPSLPDGLSARDYQTGSWSSAPQSVKNLDLTYANFIHITDMSLSDLGYTKLTSLSLPISEDTIPVRCLNATTTLTKLCVPANYKVIQAYAFPASLNHITTTGVVDGNVVEIDNGDLSITLSAGLEKIESHAFIYVTHVRDVYVLKVDAPICELDAFSTMTYYANNTIEGASDGAVTRDSYCKNGGAESGGGWMAVLHYPAEANTYAQTIKYTDVTRDFSISTGERDGRGNLIMYPNQPEVNRAFVQACCGYTWNSTNNTRTTDGTYSFVNYTATGTTDTNKSASDYSMTPDGQPTATYDVANYGGWHQFLLTSYAPIVDTPPTDYIFNTGNVFDNEWWTICLPIPLTKAMMLDVFGDKNTNAYPKLCRFVGVDRVVDEKIVLRFGEDLVAAATSNDAIVLEAGRPYMIKPHLPAEASGESRIVRVPIDNTNKDIYKTLTKDEQESMLKAKVEIVNSDNIRIFADAASYEQGITTDANADTGVNAPYTNYTFVGTFWKYSLPQYSYFLGWDSSAAKVKYFWKYSPVDFTNRSWNTCTAVICPNWDLNATFVEPADGSLESVHWNLGTPTSTTYTFSQSDAFKGWSEVKPQESVEFAFECETDGISNVHMGDGSTVSFVKGTVYNLNGQAVKSSQLTKGLYIVNGKKFIVK